MRGFCYLNIEMMQRSSIARIIYAPKTSRGCSLFSVHTVSTRFGKGELYPVMLDCEYVHRGVHRFGRKILLGIVRITRVRSGVFLPGSAHRVDMEAPTVLVEILPRDKKSARALFTSLFSQALPVQLLARHLVLIFLALSQ